MESNIYIVGEIGLNYTYNHALSDYQRVKESEILNIYIASPGGDLYEGRDIAKLFKESGKLIKTYNIGDVASIAFNIFLAARRENRYFNPEKGGLLIHYPWGEAVGNADELQQYSDQLREEEKNLVKELTTELGVDEVVLRGYMKQERFLTEDEISLLNIANIVKQEFKAVAKLKRESMNEKEVKEELSGIRKAIEGFKAIFKPKALLIQDVNGAEINLPDIETVEQLQTGLQGTVNGEQANGDYTLDDGTVLRFEAGALIEVVLPQGEDEMEALKAENESLKKQIEDMQASVLAKEKEAKTIKVEAEKIEARFKAFQDKFSSEFVSTPGLEDEIEKTKNRKPFKTK